MEVLIITPSQFTKVGFMRPCGDKSFWKVFSFPLVPSLYQTYLREVFFLHHKNTAIMKPSLTQHDKSRFTHSDCVKANRIIDFLLNLSAIYDSSRTALPKVGPHNLHTQTLSAIRPSSHSPPPPHLPTHLQTTRVNH